MRSCIGDRKKRCSGYDDASGGTSPSPIAIPHHGHSIFTDEVLKSVEKELYTYLNKEKPEIFGQPLPLSSDLSNMDINEPASYDFEFEMGLKPDYAIADLSKAKAVLFSITISSHLSDH